MRIRDAMPYHRGLLCCPRALHTTIWPAQTLPYRLSVKTDPLQSMPSFKDIRLFAIRYTISPDEVRAEPGCL